MRVWHTKKIEFSDSGWCVDKNCCTSFVKTLLDRVFVYLYLFDHKLFRSQMVSFGFSKMIKPFSDMVAWLKKVDFIANLEGILDVASVILSMCL